MADAGRPGLQIAELPFETGGRIHEQGWQSWTPSTTYRIGEPPIRVPGEFAAAMHRGAAGPATAGRYGGQGLLAVQPAPGGPVHVFAVIDARKDVPSIRAQIVGTRLVVTTDSAAGAIEHTRDDGPGGIDGALARWADRFAVAMAVPPIRRAPTAWCTWYHYFTDVTAADVDENLAAIERLGLPVDVIQVDDGYQSQVGDWLTWANRFGDVEALVKRIRDAGRRAGIWVAPFIASERSETAVRHPDWLIGVGGPTPVLRNWDQVQYALDVTLAEVHERLTETFGRLRAMGIDYFKIDFIYGAAVDGPRASGVSPIAAYRGGIETIRAAIGDAYLVGCGGPILPTVGLVDAMRISPDTAPHFEPAGGDLSEPGARSAIVTGVGRAFQHGRFWVNDPDCLIVRPAVERREAWAGHVERFGGLRASSDRLVALDPWGLETTRRLLSTSPRESFVASGPAADATAAG